MTDYRSAYTGSIVLTQRTLPCLPASYPPTHNTDFSIQLRYLESAEELPSVNQLKCERNVSLSHNALELQQFLVT